MDIIPDQPRLNPTVERAAEPADADLCRHLRSKEMYIHVDQLDWKTEGSASGSYWCLHTQSCIGLDGQVAEPAACRAGRSCHEWA